MAGANLNSRPADGAKRAAVDGSFRRGGGGHRRLPALTLLPLDDCLYALQPTIPHLTRSSLHRCLQRHGIGRLPDVESDRPTKRKFRSYPIGYFHIDVAEVRTEQGKLHIFVAIDRTSKFAFVAWCRRIGRSPHQRGHRKWGALPGACLRIRLRHKRHRTPDHQSQAPVDH
ncbi:hypothetical protein MPLSOD_390003 [Mesorhizobium sp. SOD10]|nr:hypothetical protein MPLSOD_390003 [Mesorhizobium sp. SOD10]